MTEDEIEKKREHASEKKPSMKRRSDVNNYYGHNIYMLTMAVEGRRRLLGSLQTEDGDPATAYVRLTDLGRDVYACWQAIPFYHPEVKILAFQVMPDHIHGVLQVKEDMQQHLGQVVSGFKAGCNKAYRRLFAEAVPQPTTTPALPCPNAAAPSAPAPSGASASVPSAEGTAVGAPAGTSTAPSAEGTAVGAPVGTSAVPSAEGTAVGALTGTSTSALSAEGTAMQAPVGTSASAPSAEGTAVGAPVDTSAAPSAEGTAVGASGCSYEAAPPLHPSLPLPSEHRLKKEDRHRGLLFERGYNDLISKSYDMLPRLIAYVHDNPRRLAIRRAYPDYFRVRFGVTVGPQTYAAIGNRFLLAHPERVQVQLTRSLTPAEIAAQVDRFLGMARQGAVLVSPAISEGERAVMRAVLDARLPLVFLTPWGFNSFSRPGHQYYDACSEGRLLILAPWPHQNERIPLTRDMCLLLNRMAQNICHYEVTPLKNE